MSCIKKIEYLGEKTPSQRKLKLTSSDGKITYAIASHESYMQWGSGELKLTLPIVEAHNDWLHGGKKLFD